MNKKVISLINGLYILANNKNPVFITVQAEEKNNIIPITWLTPVSIDPPKVAICIMKKNFSNGLLMKSDNYVINGMETPDPKWLKMCGTTSGKDTDKFKLVGLTPSNAQKVESPLIAECDWHLELLIKERMEMGTHTMFVGEVISSMIREALIPKYVNTISWQ